MKIVVLLGTGTITYAILHGVGVPLVGASILGWVVGFIVLAFYMSRTQETPNE